MKKKTKILLVLFIAFFAIGFSTYYYVIHAGARNLETETASFLVTSTSITSEFTSDLNAANKKYLEKAVSISGKITTLNDSILVLDNTIFCNLKNSEKSLKTNQNITVKGRIVGYDDLMGELKLDQCFINK